jgi:hypothetical protein
MEVWKNRYHDGCSYEQFMKLSQKPCHYCGTVQSCSRGRKNQETFSYNGLDRVDPDGNHSAGNVVPCCKTCNRAKLDTPYDQFLDWIRSVHQHLKLT